MALLDTNKDGKLSGAELDGLALWFDKNRDGAVGQAELLTLEDADVTALYYKWDKRDSKTGDLWTSVGYERTVNGKTVQGRSVDWFTQTFATKDEAITALPVIFQAEASKSSATATSETWKTGVLSADKALAKLPAYAGDFAPHVAKNHSKDLSGYWLWHIAEDKGGKHPGVFAFEQLDEHTLIGYSVAEVPLAKNKQGFRSGVRALPALGQISVKKRHRELTMEVNDPKSGGTAKSTATLSSDGKVLHGKTTQSYSVPQDQEHAQPVLAMTGLQRSLPGLPK